MCAPLCKIFGYKDNTPHKENITHQDHMSRSILEHTEITILSKKISSYCDRLCFCALRWDFESHRNSDRCEAVGRAYPLYSTGFQPGDAKQTNPSIQSFNPYSPSRKPSTKTHQIDANTTTYERCLGYEHSHIRTAGYECTHIWMEFRIRIKSCTYGC